MADKGSSKGYVPGSASRIRIGVLEGSFTVEAALIMPLMIAVIFGVFWLLFYMYARIKTDADLDRAAFEMVQYIAATGKTDDGPGMTVFLDRNIRDYPYFTITDRKMEIGHNGISLEASLKMMGNRGLSGIFTNKTETVKAAATVKYWDCPKIKRTIDVIIQTKQE